MKKKIKYSLEEEIIFYYHGICRHRSHCKGKDWKGYYKRNKDKCKLEHLHKKKGYKIAGEPIKDTCPECGRKGKDRIEECYFFEQI